jgi:hypothetical protein
MQDVLVPSGHSVAMAVNANAAAALSKQAPLHDATVAASEEKETLDKLANNLVIGPNIRRDVRGEHKIHLGDIPAYFIGEHVAHTLVRQPVEPVSKKRYVGYDRLTQSLRHLAVMINTTMKIHMQCDPLEVQTSVFGGKLHVSSNFHTDKAVDALRRALLDPPPHDRSAEHVHEGDRALWDKVIAARRVRHMRKFMDTFTSRKNLDAVIAKSRIEIGRGMGIRQGSNLDRDAIAAQCRDGFQTIFNAISELSKHGQSAHIIVHHPFRDDGLKGKIPHGITETRHAELNIEDYLARNSDEIYASSIETLGLRRGQHVIVNMAGRFVPCAVCHEVEHASVKHGFFNPDRNRFVLWRSSTRAGRAFENEIQHFPLSVLDPENRTRALDTAARIRDRFLHDQQALQSYNQPVVNAYSLDTDSESSGAESWPAPDPGSRAP